MDDTVYDGTGLPPTSVKAPAPEPVTVPAGSLAERIEWVAAGETQEVRHERASEVYSHEQAAGDTDLGELGRVLTGVVYQVPVEPVAAPEPDTGAAATGQGDDGPSSEEAAQSGPDADTVTAPEAVVAPAVDGTQEIPGQFVESDTAGTGEAVNAETGEVTQPGQPLPTIEQDTGDQLAPASQDTGETPSAGEQQQNTD